MVKTFLEYRMVKRARGLVERETADYVADEKISENRIIPDAAFIIENIETNKRALFFVEMDMATETIVNRITRDKRVTIYNKMLQYDRYLQSLRYNETYASSRSGPRGWFWPRRILTTTRPTTGSKT